eukprot:NODE_1365_length_2504_cov_6.672276.p1 GENE.NODE_1365_length_2504_cov_6.672276~~NODE_1365_length_2504_cov_6.672276.p1  ORF type:complete len:549 (-),score=118.58 NODE_1365_length_2504_cov_6.672276:51-1697(-)
MLLLDGAALVLNGGTPCLTMWSGASPNTLLAWVAVDAAALAFEVVVRGTAYLQVGKSLAETAHAAQAPHALPTGPVNAARALLDRHLAEGARALLAYDRVMCSVSFRALDYLSVFSFGWLIAGLAVVLNTPTSACDATLLLAVARLRSLGFLIGFVPSLLGLLIGVTKVVGRSNALCTSVLASAQQLDDNWFPSGLPVAVLLVRAFLVRDSTDMAGLELLLLREEQKHLAERREVLRSELADVEARAMEAEAKAQARLQHPMTAAATPEAHFFERYQHAVDHVAGSVMATASGTTPTLQQFRAVTQCISSGGEVPVFLGETAATTDNSAGGSSSVANEPMMRCQLPSNPMRHLSDLASSAASSAASNWNPVLQDRLHLTVANALATSTGATAKAAGAAAAAVLPSPQGVGAAGADGEVVDVEGDGRVLEEEVPEQRQAVGVASLASALVGHVSHVSQISAVASAWGPVLQNHLQVAAAGRDAVSSPSPTSSLDIAHESRSRERATELNVLGECQEARPIQGGVEVVASPREAAVASSSAGPWASRMDG